MISCGTFVYRIAPWTFSIQCDFLFNLQGLISGSAEIREQAALGLGELIEVTSEKTLKEFVIPITGYAPCFTNTTFIPA